MSAWDVEFSPRAQADLVRLYEFLNQHDDKVAEEALREISRAVEMLRRFPRSCRRTTGSSKAELRELVVPFGNAGYVVLFRIEPPTQVQILGVRHQREDDF